MNGKFWKIAREVLPYTLAALGLAGTLLNFYLTARLIPLADSINANQAVAQAFYTTHQTDVSQAQFTVLEDQINTIQNQVQALYNHFIYPN